MSFDKSEIENNIKQHIKESNPELLLYIDNHYIDELINFKDLKSVFDDYDMILIPWEDEEKLALKELWKSKYNEKQDEIDKEENEKNRKDNNQNLYKDKQMSNELLNDVEKLGIENVLVIIGPEGGFTTDEVEFVQKNGGHAITLGPRILRTETAGFVALTALLYQADELG